MKNKISILLYTNNKCSDLHPIFFDRLNKNFQSFDELVVLNNSTIKQDIKHKLILYDDGQPYYKQMITAIDSVDNEFLIYSQEDYILYDKVDIDKIDHLVNFMIKNEHINFIRLIKSGFNGNESKYNDELLLLDSNSTYYFSTQITIWRKKSLKDMFERSEVDSIFNEPYNSTYLKEIGGIGLCVSHGGEKIGNHYNSIIYPYLATAVVKGNWNTLDYKDELDVIFEEYNIDKNIRGVNE